MGIVRVAPIAARVPGVLTATITDFAEAFAKTPPAPTAAGPA